MKRALAILILLAAFIGWAAHYFGNVSKHWATGAAAWEYYATEFDGDNDCLVLGGALTNCVDGKAGSISFWFKLNADSTNNQPLYLLQNTGDYIEFYRNVNQTWKFVCCDSGGSTLLSIYTTSTYGSNAPTWHHLCASWNLAASNIHLYVDGVSNMTTTTVKNGTIDYTRAQWAVGAKVTAANKYDGDLCELWFNTEYIDLSVSGNRDKFFNSGTSKPVNLGADGSTPTGNQPLIYLHNAYDTFQINLGKGGNFTVTGALTNSLTKP